MRSALLYKESRSRRMASVALPAYSIRNRISGDTKSEWFELNRSCSSNQAAPSLASSKREHYQAKGNILQIPELARERNATQHDPDCMMAIFRLFSIAAVTRKSRDQSVEKGRKERMPKTYSRSVFLLAIPLIRRRSGPRRRKVLQCRNIRLKSSTHSVR